MKNKKLNNTEKIELIIEDLGKWIDGSEYDGSLEFAYRHGYYLHAANLWLSSGAMSEDIESLVKGVKISKTKELKEINQLCEQAYMYECKHCNHIAFLDDDEGEQIECMSCSKVADRYRDAA